MFEIIDDNGTIHSGELEEMARAYDIMLDQCEDVDEEEIEMYCTEWNGDLKLIQILNVN